MPTAPASAAASEIAHQSQSRRAGPSVLTRRQQRPEALAPLADGPRQPRLAADRDLPGPQRVAPARLRCTGQRRPEDTIVRDGHQRRP